MNETIRTVDPATGEALSSWELMSEATVEQRIERCHEAQQEWRYRSLEQRADVLRRIGQALRDHQASLAKLMTSEMGKLLQQSEQEIDLCAGICDYTAEHGPKELAREERGLQKGQRGIISYEPIGLVYGIQPWNYPAYQVVRYSIASLMAGNGVLLKHARNVTGTGLELEKLFKVGGLPDNLFSVLTISHEVSDKVIEHRHVRGVTLTGSPEAGAAIASKAGAALKKTVLELGANDAYVILADADIERAVQYSVLGRTYNNGETCIAAKRFVVVDAVYEQFRDQFVTAMQQLKVGDPSADDTELGPIARSDLRDVLHGQVETSIDNGARLLCGGEIPKGPGFYYPPTVLEDVAPGQPAYCDELFGPVAALIRAKDEIHALELANDSRFGLGGGIISSNVDRAIELAATELDTGMVFINGFGLADPAMPFGGIKNSGYGREHGGFGLREFVNAKAIMVMNPAH